MRPTHSVAPELRPTIHRNGVPSPDPPRGLGAKVDASITRDAGLESGVAQPVGDITRPRLHHAPNAIAYLRVSTDKQADSGLGLEAQRAQITAAADRHGLTVREFHIDAGMSGALSFAERPVLVYAVSVLRRGDILLVAKRDRLGRDRTEVGLIERFVQKQGARVMSAAGEGTDSDDPASVLMRGQVDGFAEYERAVGVTRTKAALAAKRERGERVGTVPFGFQVAEASRTLSRSGRPAQLEPAPVEQRLLARVHELKAEGLSLRKIRDELNQNGWTTRRGTTWRHEYVYRVLRRG